MQWSIFLSLQTGYVHCWSYPSAGSTVTPSTVTCPAFMPTFPDAASYLDTLPSAAAMAQARPPHQGAPSAVSPTLPVIPPPAVQPPPTPSIPGFSAVPVKLVRKIWALDYIDMWELLPETWHLDTTSISCCHDRRPRRGLVTDISLWIDCFATLAAVPSVRYPDKAPQFMAYMRTIVRASRNFEGPAWATYDMAFRRQAANRQSLDWGITDPVLYNEAFTGRAKAIPRCRYCLSDSHASHDCSYAPDDTKQHRPFPQNRTSTTPVAQICRLFNRPGGSQCRYKYCRYAHLCARCSRPHPAADCDRRQPAQGPRSPSPTTRDRA